MALGRHASGAASGVRIATPMSDLFGDPEQARLITDASDLLEIRHPPQATNVWGSVLYHCELSLVASWGDAGLAGLAATARGLAESGARLEAVSFHLASRYPMNVVRDGAFVGQGMPMDAGLMLATAAHNADLARLSFPGVPLMVENNNHLGTDAYEVVTDGAFIAELAVAADAGILLDVAHARITAANTGVEEQEYLSALPLERVWQVHLSRHGYAHGRATDAHEMLREDDWDYFAALSTRMINLRFATIEYYRDALGLLAQIDRLRSALKAYS